MKKSVPGILIAMLSAGLLFSQSLVDASKAEKERREKLKGKNVKVITNADLQSGSKKPALVTAPAEAKTDQAAGQTAAGPGEQEAPPAAQKALRLRSGGRESFPYARQVLPESYLVENPERALNYPDSQYAEISMLGLLDLEFSARNGTGNDIAIYARLAGLKELMEAQAQQEEGLTAYATDFQYWEGFWYGVLVMGENGDWEVIGQGTGRNSPETFELGRIQSIKKIRIMFKPHNNPDLPFKLPRLTPAEFTFGIDAVEALH
jgi:hypothetical protein